MKSPEQTAFKAILVIAVIIAVAALPLVARSDDHRPAPPTFEQFDADGDGFVSEEEFVTFRAARMKERAEAGHMMRGAAKAPPFSDFDANGDGKLDLDEFTAGREAHRAMMREGRGGHHGGCNCHGKGEGGRHDHARPMPTFGDLNLDGVLSAEDIDVLCGAIQSDDRTFDLSGDDRLDEDDVVALVEGRMGKSVGDANLDGLFDSQDLVLIFQAGEYEDSVTNNSSWREGDWNCDGEFDSGDIVFAFRRGHYRLE